MHKINYLRDAEEATRFHGLVTLMRPKQWIKNGFVLAALVFSGKFLDMGAVGQSCLAALFFCIASSASYLVNDLHDIDFDRQHSKKAKTRPLAAGIVSTTMALKLLAVLYVTMALGWLIMPNVVHVIAAYMVLNLAYTFVLKHRPVLDIFCIAIGFVLRVYAGAVALSVPLSGWMFITTLCLALYLTSVKRQQELRQNGTEGRLVLEKYTLPLVSRYAEMSATGAIVFYSMFVISAKPQLVMTIPFVLFGLYRYGYIVEILGGGQSPSDELLIDPQLLLTVLLWVIACCWALWPT